MPPDSIVVSVFGAPAPQGSKRHVGHGVMIESSKNVKPWREAVKWSVRAAYPDGPFPLVPGPVEMTITFHMRRPKKPKHEWPAGRPDLSKLIRATEDALTEAGAWEDDSRVVSIHARKEYRDVPCGATIEVRRAGR